MKKSILLRLAFIWLGIFTTHVSFASHFSGADLTYKHLGGDSYEFTFKFFRDCSGANEPDKVPICIKDLCGGTVIGDSLKKYNGLISGGRPNGSQTSTGCPGFPNQCIDFFSPLPGFQEWWYRDTLSLSPLNSSCDEWLFYVEFCCRNGSSNLFNSITFHMYVESYLNRIAVPSSFENNSAEYTNAPIPYFCISQPATFNHGVVDADGDSLVFTSVNPLEKVGCDTLPPNIMAYSDPSFNPSNPFNSSNTFGIDPQTGQISFTSPITQSPIISMRTDEYRNGVLVGYTMRDIQMIILNCNTTYPTLQIDTPSLSGASFGPLGIEMCGSDNLSFCFDIESADPNAILLVTDNSSIQAPGSSVSYTNMATDSVNGCMNWQPSPNDSGFIILTFTAVDSSCTPPGYVTSQIFSIPLFVSPQIQLSLNKQDANCQVLTSGSITATTNTPVTFTLQPGNISNTDGNFTMLGPGSYTVYAQNAHCMDSATITIIQPPTVSFGTPAIGIPTCVNANSGTINITASGGTPAYTYTLNPGAQTNSTGTFTGLTAGVYTITVADAALCSTLTTINITNPSAPTWSNVSGSNPTCSNANGGSISASASGGTAPLTYNLMPGNINNGTGSFSGLSATSYTITVSDASGCTASTTVILSIPPLPIWSSSIVNNVLCNGDNTGSISVLATTSASSITYNLMPGNVNNATGSFSNLAAGSYTVTAIDNLGCDTSINLNISQPPALLWNADTITNVLCNGGAGGSIAISASGGTAGNSYTLMPGSMTNATGNFANLSAGGYTITATDANNCTTSTSLNISQPMPLQIMTLNGTTPSCVPGNDATITITATGGTTNYQYNIGSGNQASNVFNNVGAGVYTVTVTDANGCTTSSSIIIAPPNAPSITNVSSNNVQCNGINDGSITTTATGGTIPLNYNLMPGNVSNGTGSFNSLGAGTYTITVSDANSCSISSTVVISEPTILVIDSIVSVDPNCVPGSDGSLSIYSSGGTPALSYSIGGPSQASNMFNGLGAANYTIMVSDANNCRASTSANLNAPIAPTFDSVLTNSILCNGDGNGVINAFGSGSSTLTYSAQPLNVSNSTGQFSNLNGGNYSITITDAQGCTNTSLVQVLEPALLEIDSSVITDINCSSVGLGIIDMYVSGGTAGYSYNLQPGNITNNTGQFMNLVSGLYTVVVTDANGCTTTTISSISNISSLQSNFSQSDISCFNGTDGSIQSNALGGIAPYTYTIQPGATSNNSGSFAGLGAGTYSIYIQDQNGCQDSIIGIQLINPQPISITNIALQDINCFGESTGTIGLSATGGTGSLTFGLVPNLGSQITPGQFNNLPSGSYQIQILDSLGCLADTTISLNQNAALEFGNISIMEPLCSGGNDGSITLTALGGTPAYLYGILPNPLSATNSFSNLNSGTYTIRIQDALGCQKDTIITIQDPPAIGVVNIEINNISCPGNNDAQLTISATGGTGALTYLMTPGNVSNQTGFFNNLSVGTYDINISDANGCNIDVQVFILAPTDTLSLSIQKEDFGCWADNTIAWAEAFPTGGTPPYSYLWNTIPPSISSRIEPTNTGWVQILITDAQGCTALDSVYIEPGPCCFDIFVPSAFSPNGDNTNDTWGARTNADIQFFQLAIYNRWGERIWHTNDITRRWDGNYKGEYTPVSTYYYFLEFICNTDGKRRVKRGDLTVIR